MISQDYARFLIKNKILHDHKRLFKIWIKTWGKVFDFNWIKTANIIFSTISLPLVEFLTYFSTFLTS